MIVKLSNHGRYSGVVIRYNAQLGFHCTNLEPSLILVIPKVVHCSRTGRTA